MSPLVEFDSLSPTAARPASGADRWSRAGKRRHSEWASEPAQSTAGFPSRGEPARGARVRLVHSNGCNLLRRTAGGHAGEAGAVHTSGGAGIDSPSKKEPRRDLEVNNSRAGESGALHTARSYTPVSSGGGKDRRVGMCRAGRSERVKNEVAAGGAAPRGTSTKRLSKRPVADSYIFTHYREWRERERRSGVARSRVGLVVGAGQPSPS